jgi:hypothetical protein
MKVSFNEGDPRVVRQIQKWLNAGVTEEGMCVKQLPIEHCPRDRSGIICLPCGHPMFRLAAPASSPSDSD